MSWLPDSVLDHLRRVSALNAPWDTDPRPTSRYELGEIIGAGGMGLVYRAFDRELGREVAVKALTSPASPQIAERLARESRILARLEHPGIVPVHDAGVLADGRVFYVMKLVRGKPLDELGTDATSLAERLRIFERICDAVAFAHAEGVIHRDLKPQNVMVGRFGEVLVMDWGVARVLGGHVGGTCQGDMSPDMSPRTSHGTIIGTPGYMAPEQERGEPARMDVRTDVYALGALLGFLLRGLAGRGPRQLEAIRDKAAAHDPGDRYATVPDLIEDVRRFQAGDAVNAYPETPLERAGRWVRNYRVPLLLVVAYLLMRMLLLLV